MRRWILGLGLLLSLWACSGCGPALVIGMGAMGASGFVLGREVTRDEKSPTAAPVEPGADASPR